MTDDTPPLAALFPAFVRAFGFHRPLHTPCGVPLSVAEAHALTELQSRQLTQSALAERLQLEKSTISRLVSQMEQQGWLARQAAPGDSRARILTLTDAGGTLAQQVQAARAAKFASMLDRLSADEQIQIQAALQRLIEVANETTP